MWNDWLYILLPEFTGSRKNNIFLTIEETFLLMKGRIK